MTSLPPAPSERWGFTLAIAASAKEVSTLSSAGGVAYHRKWGSRADTPGPVSEELQLAWPLCVAIGGVACGMSGPL